MKKALLILGSAVLLYSCGNDTANTDAGTTGTTTSISTSSSSSNKSNSNMTFADANTLQQAEDALKALPQFAGKELNVFQNVHFYNDGRIIIEIQDPK